MADSLLGGIVINEILVDPNGAANFDTDGNGTASFLDEYVEIANVSGAAIDISGLELWDTGSNNWFTFPSGTILQPGAHAVVVTGVQTGGSLPSGGTDLYFDAGRGSAVLNNGGDNVVLYDPTNDEYIAATYNGATVVDPTTSGDGNFDLFSATATQSGSGENFGSDNDGFSIQRTSDGADTFVNDETPTPGTNNICFTGGTIFETPEGPTLIDNLRPGDQLFTKDNGPQTIKWIWAKVWTTAELRKNPNLYPVRVKKDAFGNGLPERELLVSRQHRILVGSRIVQRMFDCAEVLVPAKDLLELDGVDIVTDCETMTYYHILLEQHEIVFANGVPSESLHLGPESLKMMENEAIEELCKIFRMEPGILPKLTSLPVRTCVAGNKARTLAHRHAKNAKAISAFHFSQINPPCVDIRTHL
ncbi:MAG: Hint domain-containing protein [Litoreibacter sp.]